MKQHERIEEYASEKKFDVTVYDSVNKFMRNFQKKQNCIDIKRFMVARGWS